MSVKRHRQLAAIFLDAYMSSKFGAKGGFESMSLAERAHWLAGIRAVDEEIAREISRFDSVQEMAAVVGRRAGNG